MSIGSHILARMCIFDGVDMDDVDGGLGSMGRLDLGVRVRVRLRGV